MSMPDHRPLVVEQELGERARQLGLADAGRAEEDEAADRPVRILEPGARAAHRVRDRRRPLRPGRSRARAAAPPCGPASPSRPRAAGRRECRSTRRPPRRCRRRRPPPSACVALRRWSRLLPRLASASARRSRRSGISADALQVAARAASRSGSRPRALRRSARVERRWTRGDPRPARLAQRCRVSSLQSPLRLRELVVQLLQPLAGRVGLWPARRARSRAGGTRRCASSSSAGRVDLHAQPRGGLVDQVDRLVRQEAVGDVAVREHRRGDDRARRVIRTPWCDLVALLQAAQDRDRVLDASARRRRPAGSAARAPRPSRCACGTRRAWSRRRSAARRAPASASADWRRRRRPRPRPRRRSCAARR